MGRVSEYVGAVAIVIAILGLIFNQESTLLTRYFNIAILLFALIPALRRYVRMHGGGPTEVRKRTFQYILSFALFFTLMPVLGLLPLDFWNYGTLVPLTGAIVYGLYWVWKEAGHYPYMKPTIVVVGVLIFTVGSFVVPWSQVEGPAGAVGGAVQSSVEGVTSTVSTAGTYSYNALLKNNPSVARIQCIMEHGGPTGVAFTSSAKISDCVKQKMGENETVSESDQITEPIKVSMGEIEIEPVPRRENVNVRVPVSNALVYDRSGVPVDIPAKNLDVWVVWKKNGEIVATKSVNSGDEGVPEELGNGDYRVISVDFEVPDKPWDDSQLKEGNIVPGMGPYDVGATVTYTYSAEAAFTQSSRWKSGNYLLEVWRPDAWREKSPDFRRSWEQEKCDTVRKFGQEFDKQRTAALTTPVTPVMYTDCSTTLFSRFEDGSGKVPISISAVGPKEGEGVESFSIEGGGTDCRAKSPGSSSEFEEFGEDIGWDELDVLKTFSPGDGWDVNPVVVNREVDIAGESTSISCKVNMSIRMQLEGREQDEVSIPGFDTSDQTLDGTDDTSDETTVQEFDWNSLSVSDDGSTATLSFGEELSIEDNTGDEVEIKAPEGASVGGFSLSSPLDTLEIDLSGVNPDDVDEITVTIAGTLTSQSGNSISGVDCTASIGGESNCG